MWLNQLRQAHIIDASAYAMGCFINQSNQSASEWPGLLCALSMQAIKQGHTCLDFTRITAQFPALLNFPDLLDSIAVSTLGNNARIGQDTLQSNTLFTVAPPYLFCNTFFDLEQRLLQAIAARLTTQDRPAHLNPAEQLAQLCLAKPLCFLSGGPGTGKTTVLSQALPRIIELFQQKFNRLPIIRLCAPTGKAAARMTAAWLAHKQHLLATKQHSEFLSCVPEQAITLHRLLSIHPLSKQAQFSPRHSLPVDFVVVDEASMIDLPLFVQLFEALPKHAHMLLIGDPNQLPAVEAGNILGSLLQASAEPSFFSQLQRAHLHLSINYRQIHHPGLSELASDCLLASPAKLVEKLAAQHYSHVTWQENSTLALSETLLQASAHYAQLALCENAHAALMAARNFTLLTAVHDGPYGCRAINHAIMRKLNPSFQRFFHGQLLLITENAQHLGLANGDIGIVWRQANHQLMASFETNGVIQTRELIELPAFELAYALTIHKSQGSEYNAVSVVLPEQDNPVLSKALLYTAFTRARHGLTILATKQRLIDSFEKPNRRVNGLVQLAELLMKQKIQ